MYCFLINWLFCGGRQVYLRKVLRGFLTFLRFFNSRCFAVEINFILTPVAAMRTTFSHARNESTHSEHFLANRSVLGILTKLVWLNSLKKCSIQFWLLTKLPNIKKWLIKCYWNGDQTSVVWQNIQIENLGAYIARRLLNKRLKVL